MTAVYAGALAAVFVAGLLLVLAGWYGSTARHGGVTAAGSRPRWWSAGPRPWWWSAGRRPARATRRAVAVAATVAGVAGYGVTGVPAVGLLLAAAVPVVPWLWHAGRAEERAIARVEALTGWTLRLKDQLSTGAGLVSAVVATAGGAPAAVAEPVAALAARLQAGTDPERALRAFAADLADPVADQVVAALLLHLRDRGQHLAEVLAAVAGDAAAQVAMRREVHARRTQPRLTVRFMTVFGVGVAVVLARGDLLAAYATPTGQVVLVVLAGLFVATLAWVRAMSRPGNQPRFLGGDG